MNIEQLETLVRNSITYPLGEGEWVVTQVASHPELYHITLETDRRLTAYVVDTRKYVVLVVSPNLSPADAVRRTAKRF